MNRIAIAVGIFLCSMTGQWNIFLVSLSALHKMDWFCWTFKDCGLNGKTMLACLKEHLSDHTELFCFHGCTHNEHLLLCWFAFFISIVFDDKVFWLHSKIIDHCQTYLNDR
jgi:hypothetical protein